jgi:hypothetical protein
VVVETSTSTSDRAIPWRESLENTGKEGLDKLNREKETCHDIWARLLLASWVGQPFSRERWHIRAAADHSNLSPRSRRTKAVAYSADNEHMVSELERARTIAASNLCYEQKDIKLSRAAQK